MWWCVKCGCAGVFAWNIGMTSIYIWVFVIEYLCLCMYVFVSNNMWWCLGDGCPDNALYLCILFAFLFRYIFISMYLSIFLYIFVCICICICQQQCLIVPWWGWEVTSSRRRTPVGPHKYLYICYWVFSYLYLSICICICQQQCVMVSWQDK